MNQTDRPSPVEFNYSALETVICGESVVDALPRQVAALAAKRVFLLASNSLQQATDSFRDVREALGSSYAGLFHQIGAHSPRRDVLLALQAARGVETEEQLLEILQLASE